MNVQTLIDYGVPEGVVTQFQARAFKALTAVQVAALQAGLLNTQSLIISAPTSAGKTTIAELAAVIAAQQRRKTVYLVTHKALAEEKYRFFKTSYDSENNSWFPVSISTGDRLEGSWNSGILIATYEKFLSLVNTKAANLSNLVVVADEVQTVAAATRGADIEILCTILLHTKPAQFIGLTATAPNTAQLATWLGCTPCEVKTRDIPLRQEIWYQGNITHCMSGDSESFHQTKKTDARGETLAVAKELVDQKVGPVLVFCMTKPRAEELAKEFAGMVSSGARAIHVSRQLDLFSEPTSLGERLREVTQQRAAFHTADLSYEERGVVEQALRDGHLDIVFATPTLAAGVNLPIRTVVFDSFERPWVPEWLPHSEYTNMAGRAGRLGFHSEGTAVLLPRNKVEYTTAHGYITQQPEKVHSVLMERSIRKPILQLVACGICGSREELSAFFAKTLWYLQTLDANPELCARLETRLEEGLNWLLDVGLLVLAGSRLIATELGRAVSGTGLLPSTVISILPLVTAVDPATFDQRTLALLHLACASDEFVEGTGQRFLPNAQRAHPSAYKAIRACNPLVEPDARANQPRVDNAAFMLSCWIEGRSEQDLIRSGPPIRYGTLQALAEEVSWIFDGICSVLASPAVDADPKLITEIELLSKRVELGVAVDAIDVLDAAKASRVPGFGRNRAMSLVAAGLAQPSKLLTAKIEDLTKIVHSVERAQALLAAVAQMSAKPMEFWRNRQIQAASEAGADTKLIEALYDIDGSAYEEYVLELLRRMELPAEKFDDGKKQGAPDIVIRLERGDVFVECKSREHKKSSPISTEDAFAVLAKANDLGAIHCVTVAKPDVGSHAKKKATSEGKITLIAHKTLIQAYIAYFSHLVPKHKIETWLCHPGVAHDLN